LEYLATAPAKHSALQHLTTRPLTGGVTGVRGSKHACVLKADKFYHMLCHYKLICVDIGNRI